MKKEVQESMIIRNLQSINELEEVKRLEAMIWSMEDAVPVNQSVAAVKNGGFILGAFFKTELIGFQYSFPGYDGKKVYLVSHSLGIHPDYRKFGIGEKLKIAQKETALEMGYDLITWTYDPLETINGNLNLHKLGAIATEYIPNVYGEMADNLNAGISTDRFLVEWHLNEPTSEYAKQANIPYALYTCEKNDFPFPEKTDLTLNSPHIFVPVPGQFQEIKKADFKIAKQWREKTSEVFSHYLSQGFAVSDLVRDNQHIGQYLYLLVKGEG
ncbi:GNAT family N-acetyltransferase [Metabacillus idriensis]|uniref:GNAT family N-acetyltransferase n=1 Tax=Metabacillus idriensis TaxID=324768 RepID=UPI00091C887B|nr:GNAT family N-acetyltransferase [Metabacillus idriensis]MCM3597852.1 GNAT family N-acetyltransferase [Metabacillus idriensis]OHR70610.1 acetyltransferase [Bacillus sp. HMSC76G11]